MLKRANYNTGIVINEVTTCDFEKLTPVSNGELLARGREGKVDPRLEGFITKKMGVERRFHVSNEMDSLDLARSALAELVKKHPNLKTEAEFLILAGISNPYPSTCTSALLAGEFELENVSCWDIKSGCSTGVLGFMQALDWFNLGAQKGILVCTETLSKFSPDDNIQISASTGDGACALYLEASKDWKVKGVVHGTDGRYLKNMYVPGRYPVDFNTFKEEDYKFTLEAKADSLQVLGGYWMNSLKEVMEISGIKGKDVQHYIPHQVDASKNKQFGMGNGIPEGSIAENFKMYGNMGCPTIFINYKKWIEREGHAFNKGDHMILHAVGGGFSWAALCMEKVN